MPAFLRGISSISPLYWGAYIICNVTFEDTTFSCPANDSACYLTSGEQILKLYKYSGRDGKYGMTFHYWMLTVVTVIYMLLAVVAVRIRAYKISH
jgi:ABC-type multidrug transport system permease subunit